MIESLLEALVDTGASGIQLHLRSGSDGIIDAIIVMEKGTGEVRNEKLKSALAQPLVLQCSQSEIVESLPNELQEFVESYKTSLALSNVSALKTAHTDGQGSANNEETVGTPQASADSKKPVEVAPVEVEQDDFDLF